MNTGIIKFVLIGAMIFISATVKGDTITLYTPSAGDATYAWNTIYGPSGYGVGAMELGVSRAFDPPYGTNISVAIIEVPIAELTGDVLLSATLSLNSTGFSTWYSYGSAQLGWLDVGSQTLTGNVVTDGLGPLSTGLPNNWEFWNSDQGNGAGVKSFDVTTYVQTDLDAGRSYSTFVLSCSRDTSGAILSAENGATGPRIEVMTVPEPASIMIIVVGGLLISCFRSIIKAGNFGS